MNDGTQESSPAEALPLIVPATEVGPATNQVIPVEKPPTQSFSTEGTDFNSVAVKQSAARDWLGRLPEHPPFQMFIEESEPNEAQINSAHYAMERGIAAIGRMGGQDFIDSYVAWWDQKGYWTGEDPFGGRTPVKRT